MMGVAVEEVVATAVEAPVANGAAAVQMPRPLDPEDMRRLIRRDAQRHARLTVD
jgi:hypothetical protein